MENQNPSAANILSSAEKVDGIANATSGYLSVDDPLNMSKLFYTFYSSRALKPGQKSEDVPIIVWLQGGPGVSSQSTNFLCIGPYELIQDQGTGKWKETERKSSWNDHYNLLFIDNPRGSGYSVADQDSYVASDEQAADDLLNALLNFYKLDAFRNFNNTPLYIFGGSYAGHHIPSVSVKILQYNAKSSVSKIPLAGVGIANGYMSVEHQITEFSKFGYAVGLIDDAQRDELQVLEIGILDKIKDEKWIEANSAIFAYWGKYLSFTGEIDVSNYRKTNQKDSISQDALKMFMNDEDTIKRYHVDPTVAGRFVNFNPTVHSAMASANAKSMASNVAFMADSSLPIILFNGQDDLACPNSGVQNFTNHLKWSGQKGLYSAPFNRWISPKGSLAGRQKNYKNFYLVVVNDAGHDPTEDQLDNTIDLVKRFINKETDWTKPATNSQEK